MNSSENDGAPNHGSADAELFEEPIFEPWRYHRDLIFSRLISYISPDSFVSYVLLELAREIDEAMKDRQGYSFISSYSPEPMQRLYLWLTDGKDTFDPTWFENSEKTFITDRTKAIPPHVEPVLNPSDHLLAYAFWMLTEELESIGGLPAKDQRFNDFGWTAMEVHDHYSKCVMSGYLGLTYMRDLRPEEPVPATVSTGTRLVDFSSLGRAGAQKRHAPKARLKQYAIDLYKNGSTDGKTWNSPNDAAYALRDQVVAHGLTINAKLQPPNAQRTIADWLREYERLLKIGVQH